MALLTLGLVSCTTKNEQYYRSHPKELQQALKNCPAQQPQGLSCEQLQKLGERMNALAYQLQSSPQGFGSKIITLQENIAKQELELKQKPTPEVEASLAQKKYELAEYLAVVKWLESPES
jgi:hypothetical protein